MSPNLTEAVKREPLLYFILTVFTCALLYHLVSVGLPGSVGAAGGPPTALHCFVLVGTVAAVVALSPQSKFQRVVETKLPVLLQAALVHLYWSHL